MYSNKFIFFLIIIFILGIAASDIIASHPQHRLESYYQIQIAKSIHGTREFILDDGTRIDIVTKDKAIEVEFAHKFYEAIGQSSYYAYKTNKKPVIYLIKENSKDQRFIDRCQELCKHLQVEVHGKWENIEVNIYED